LYDKDESEDPTMMISGVAASLAAFFAFGKKLGNTAHNIANSNTDGYKKSVATITEDAVGLPQVNLMQSDAPGAMIEEYGIMREASNVDLTEELPQLIVSQRGYEANIKALKSQLDTERSLMDILA
jgi:flagellar basal body rod protein FlgG